MAIQENKRKQYNPQETFRYTTPDIKPVARPTDSFVRARLNKVEEPSNAAYLAPMTPLNRPGIISAPNAPAPSRPISMIVPDHQFVEPSDTQAILNWAASAVPQILNTANDVAEQWGKEDATKAYIETNERIAKGEDPALVMQDLRPETIMGYAERAYDTQMGEAMFLQFQTDVDTFVKKNPEMAVEDMKGQIMDMFKDYGAGQSIHFKEAFIPKTVELLGRVTKYQSDVLQKKAGEDFLDNVYTTTVSKIMEIKQQYPEDQADAAIRNYVTKVQNDGKLLMVDRDKVTKAVIDALGVELDSNSTHYRSPDELFGWTHEKDVQGGFSIYDNAKYKQIIANYEEKYTSNLRKIETEERQMDTLAKQNMMDKYEGILMDSVRNNTPLDQIEFLKMVAKDTNDYNVYKHFETAVSALNNEKWKSDPDKLFELKQPFLNGNDDQIPSIDTIMKAFDDRQISAQDRDALLNLRTNTSEPVYKAAVREILGRYKEVGGIDGEISPRQEMAVEHFNMLINAEREKTGGIPEPKRIRELIKESNSYVDSIPTKFYKTPNEFMQARTPQQLLDPDIQKGYDQYRLSFRNASKEDYMKALLDHTEKIESQQKQLWKAVRQVESGGDPNAVSKKGALGTMQTMPSTLEDPGYGVRPADKAILGSGDKAAIARERERVGIDYLEALREHYKDDIKALVAYNWGPGNADKWLKEGGNMKKLPTETRQYIAKVQAALNGKPIPNFAKTSTPDDGKEWYERDVDFGTLFGKPLAAVGTVVGRRTAGAVDSLVKSLGLTYEQQQQQQHSQRK